MSFLSPREGAGGQTDGALEGLRAKRTGVGDFWEQAKVRKSGPGAQHPSSRIPSQNANLGPQPQFFLAMLDTMESVTLFRLSLLVLLRQSLHGTFLWLYPQFLALTWALPSLLFTLERVAGLEGRDLRMPFIPRSLKTKLVKDFNRGIRIEGRSLGIFT
jgi:hypothetical protein